MLGAVAEVIEGKIETKPLRVGGTPEFQKAVSELVPMIEQMTPGIPNARWLAIRLLDGANGLECDEFRVAGTQTDAVKFTWFHKLYSNCTR